MRKAIRILIKSLLLVLACALAWLSLEALILKLDESQVPPSDGTGAGAQRILYAAGKAGAKNLWPRRLQACEDDLRRAREEVNLQLAAPWGTRDFSRSQRLSDEAQSGAFKLWRDAARHRSLTKIVAEQTIDAAADNLAEAERVTAVSAQESYVRAKLSSAAMNLQRARANWNDGRFDQALICAQDSIKESALAHRRSRQAIARFDDPSHLELWRSWIRQAVETSRMTGAASFVVVKEKHLLQVYKAGRLVRATPVDLGANSINQKSHAGDRTTPEGLYRITKKKGHGQSKYGLALLLDYPNAEDRRRFAAAKARGEITKRTGIGGLIEIHGEGGRGVDWTDGCIAPDNRDMEILFREAGVGTMVAIVGSDGGDGPIRSALRRKERR
jgi:L,D-peptidoglycan transpeptidase YkuD (ErfK/YbiS/YcfS/YnhG family)